jgi:hypothetical protein
MRSGYSIRIGKTTIGGAEAKTRPLNIYVTVRTEHTLIADARLGCKFTIRRLL